MMLCKEVAIANFWVNTTPEFTVNMYHTLIRQYNSACIFCDRSRHYPCVQVMTPVEANYTLEIRLTGYQNPTHMAADLANQRQGCCDFDPALPCESCETAISICVRERITDEVSGACGLLKLESNETGGDDEDLVFTDDIGGLSNPIIVSGDMWKVSEGRWQVRGGGLEKLCSRLALY